MTDSLKVKDLAYDLYSDRSMAAARAFGIAFKVGAGTRGLYKAFGIDLETASGRDHHQLPVPSVFLVTRGGTIRWVYSNDDYKVRPDNASLLEAAKKFAHENKSTP